MQEEFKEVKADVDMEVYGDSIVRLATSKVPISPAAALNEYAGNEPGITSEKHAKFVALFKARMILSMSGTMQERRACSAQLKNMKKLGLKSV